MEVKLMELTVEPAGQTIEFGPAEPENVQPDPPEELTGWKAQMMRTFCGR